MVFACSQIVYFMAQSYALFATLKPWGSQKVKMKQKYKRYLKRVLPGLVTGGADNDPSGIASYSLSGATYGYSQLWIMVLATPMLVAVQSMCGRVAHVRRQGLSSAFREHFGPWVSNLGSGLLLIVNVATIGADLLAISLALELLTGVSMRIWVLPVTAALWYLIVFENYKTIARWLQFMLVFFLCYFVAAILSKPHWGEVLRSMVWPLAGHPPKAYYLSAVAILGTTITPFLFYWETKQELEEHPRMQDALNQAGKEDMSNVLGYSFSQVITLSIIIAAAAAMPGHEGLVTATDAARALEPVAGPYAVYLFALGIIGSGLLAVPVLAISTATALSESAGFKHQGLSEKPSKAKGFYAVVTVSLLEGLAMLPLRIDPLHALYYSQVLAGLLAPVLLFLILVLCNRKGVMGRFTNGWFDNFFGSVTLIVMVVIAFLAFM
jgi:NRAMP (natural resistance-associated macrophage protein)-like metal ion transporter